MASKRKKSAKKEQKKKRIPYTRKPKNMTLHEWQIGLRKQFVENNEFEVRKISSAPIWTDYQVINPRNDRSYRVALRSLERGPNFCDCGDFRTNTLGTCKHVEAVMHYVKTKRGYKKYLKTTYAPLHSSIYISYGAERAIKIRFGAETSQAFEFFARSKFDDELSYPIDAVAKFPTLLKQLKKFGEPIDVKSDVLKYVVEKREQLQRRKMVSGMRRRWKSYFDDLLKIRPYPYQAQGIMKAVQAGQCLIADEMGLGKTIQAIAAAAMLRKELKIEKVVIICPTSLKYQWLSEIKKFTNLSAQIIEGNKLKRNLAYLQSNSFFNIISHHLGYFDEEQLTAFHPDLIILDEAQKIKNWETKISNSLKRVPAKYKFVLTGTPLENKIEELYSILQFTNPYLLPPIFEFLHQHRITDEAGKLIGYQNMHLVKEQLKDILIRRKKKDVLKELPDRTVQNLFLPVTAEQMAVHEDFQFKVNIIVLRWRQQGFLSEADRLSLMIYLTQMRMVCDSTYLLDQQQKRYDTKVDELKNIITEVLSVEGNKIVIFSEWLNMHALIADELTENHIDFEFLNGSVPSKKRGEMVEKFNNEENCRVFLSTDAGGTGLNLQAGSHLINVDLPWNPAKLEQRIGRIHRIGQKKNVQIINLISLGTIEHKMLHLLDFKSNMMASVLDDGEDSIFMGEKKLDKLMEEVEDVISPVEDDVAPAGPSPTEDLEDAIVRDNTDDVDKSPSIEEQMVSEVVEESKAENQTLSEDVGQANVLQGSESDDLIKVGTQFLTGLVNTLKDKQKTERMISSLVQKEGDKTYVKIPVESEKVVKDLLGALSGLFGK